MLNLVTICCTLLFSCAANPVSSVSLVRAETNAGQDKVARDSWPAFYSHFKAAVKRRDRAYLRRIMPSNFDCWGLDPCDSLNSRGLYEQRDKRNLVLRELDRRSGEGWRKIGIILGTGNPSGIDGPAFVRIVESESDCASFHLDFRYRDGRWYFEMFGRYECE